MSASWSDGFERPLQFDYPTAQALALVKQGESWVRNQVDPHYRAPDASDPKGRAATSFQAMNRALQLPGNPGTYLDSSNGLKVSTVWPQGQAIAAALDLQLLTGDDAEVRQLFGALDRYSYRGAYAPGILRPPGLTHRFVDDNLWLGLDFLQGYLQTNEASYLSKAEALYPFLISTQHPDGGLYWAESLPSPTRNAVSNLPAVEYGVRLYQLTGKQKYLDLAKTSAAFVDAHLRSPQGLVWDNLGNDGRLDKTFYSYNQGTSIRADLLLFQLEADQPHLDRAIATAQASVDYFGQGDRLWKQPPAFNAIYFRNLLALDAVAPDPRYRQSLVAYLDRAWTEGRDPSTGLFTHGGIGSYGPRMQLVDQAAMVQLYALQALPASELATVS